MIVGICMILYLTGAVLLSTVIASPWMPTLALPLFVVLIHQGRIKEMLIGLTWAIFASIPFTSLSVLALVSLYFGWAAMMIFVQRFFTQGSILQGILGAIIWEALLITILQSISPDVLILHAIHLMANVLTLSIMVYYIYKYRIDETFFETNTI